MVQPALDADGYEADHSMEPAVEMGEKRSRPACNSCGGTIVRDPEERGLCGNCRMIADDAYHRMLPDGS